MAKKKSSSVFLEPYNLLQILSQSIALIWSTLKNAFSEAKNSASESEVLSEHKKAYDAAQQEFETPEFQTKWRIFLLRSLAVQIFLFVLTLLHLVWGNLFIALQLTVVFTGSIVFFGYKPWIIRNKRIVPFRTFLRTGIAEDPNALLLWKSLKGK